MTNRADPILTDRFIIPVRARSRRSRTRRPEAANLAALARAGLPTPGGFLPAAAYRLQCERLGLDPLIGSFASGEPAGGAPRLGRDSPQALPAPITPEIFDPLLPHGGAARTRPARRGALLRADRGSRRRQFRRPVRGFLGLDSEADFLTAVRACWAALWTTNARRYMENHGLNPADTAMAVLIQPLVGTRLGGGLSETAEGPDAAERDLGPWLCDRPGRGRAGPHLAHPARLPARHPGRPQGSPRQLRPRPRRCRRAVAAGASARAPASTPARP